MESEKEYCNKQSWNQQECTKMTTQRQRTNRLPAMAHKSQFHPMSGTHESIIIRHQREGRISMHHHREGGTNRHTHTPTHTHLHVDIYDTHMQHNKLCMHMQTECETESKKQGSQENQWQFLLIFDGLSRLSGYPRISAFFGILVRSQHHKLMVSRLHL